MEIMFNYHLSYCMLYPLLGGFFKVKKVEETLQGLNEINDYSVCQIYYWNLIRLFDGLRKHLHIINHKKN